MGKYTKWRQSILKSVQLQLFISFISLPFLIAWGLPVSILTPIATLVFGPFLTVFLLISSIIFFLELLYLPNSFFLWTLEKTVNLWLACLNIDQKTWLISFAKPPIMILISITSLAFAIAHRKEISSIEKRTLYLFITLILSCLALKFFPYRYSVLETITCKKESITLINHHNNLFVIDPGCISTQSSYESWIVYTFIPELIKRTGTMNIDHFIILKINKRIFDALAVLINTVHIKHLYLPWWNDKIPLFAWRSYVKLKKELITQGGRIIPISKKRKLIQNDYLTLFVAPNTEKNIGYYDATYSPLMITGLLENETINIQNI